MNYQIIIPTHTPHFERNIRFCESFKKYCIDKNRVTLNFIVSEYEKDNLARQLDLFIDEINIKIWSLKELVKDLFNEEIVEHDLLNRIGKYNFQCLKKFVGVYIFGNPYSLLMDAETLVVRNFKIKTLFDNHFNKDKHIFYTNNNYGNFTGVHKQVTEDCLRIIGEDTNLPFYFLEAYNWFFDKNILEDLFKTIWKTNNATIFDILTKKYKIIFETPLYNLYIYHNNDKYNYKFICINDELYKIMGEKNYKEYISKKELPTAFEFHAKIMTSQYYSDVFRVFYNKNKLNFFKYGILDQHQFSPYQIKFIENTKDIIFLCTLWYYPEQELRDLENKLK